MQRTYVRADLNLDKFLTKKFFDISQGSDLSYKATFPSPMRPEDRARQATFPFPIRPEDKSQDNKFEIATTPETLKSFFESAEGKEFKQALKDNANKLIVWANKNLIDPRYIEKFINTYLNYSADDVKKNAEYFAIYSTAAPLLESIVKIVESNTIPLVLRKEAIGKLAYNLKTHEPRALIFDTYEALELNEFFANVEGEQFKKALKDNVDKLIAWTKKNDIDSTPFSKFINSYANYSATNLERNIEYFALFSIGVPLLEGIVKLLESDTIPLSLCQAPIAKLASDLMKCAPGSYTIISDAYVALIAISNLSVKWMELRRHIAEEFALKYLRKNYTKDQVKEILEIHYVNAIVNHVAKALSTNTIEDPNIHYCDQAIIEDSIYHFVHHREGISSELTTGNILGNILNSILETLHETLEELNSIGDAESIIFEINTEINKFNSKYFSDEPESTHNKETIKADLNAIISQFEKKLKESKAGERILKRLNSFTGDEKIPTFVNNQGAIISRFEAELDRYGKDNKFYDPNEIFVSEDYVTYEIGQKAEYILFLSLFERLRNSEYLNPENLVKKYELPELKATINYFPGHSLKLAYIHLEKAKVGEKNHQSFIPYFIEAFLDSNDEKKQNQLIKFITWQIDEKYWLEIVDEIGKYLKSAAHLSSTRKETEQNNLLKVISQIIVPKDKKLIHILNALPLNAARLFFNKLPKSNLSILAKNDLATFFIYADIGIVKANLHIFPDKRDVNGNTPLLFAIQAKRADIVKLLLEQGAKVNTINKDGYTPLCIAARDSDPLVVTTLLNAGALMNYRLSIEKIVKTPLHIAIDAGRTENVRVLLDELLKTNTSVITNDEHGNSPLLLAIKKGNVEMGKLLLTYDKIDVDAIDKDGKTALELAAEKGQVEVVKLLLSTNRINPNRQTNPLKKTALMLAIENNHLDVVKAFLENTPKVDINLGDKIGSTPLHWAVRSNRVEIFQLLLKAGASLDVINTLGHTPFSFAVYYNNSEIIKLLLKWGVDPNTSYEGKTLLIYAAINNHFEAIKALLESEKTNLNAVTHEGATVLHIAGERGNGHIIELLLAKGANPNVVNTFGQTPLHRAVVGNREAAVEALLKSSDIDPNYIDITGSTPLSYALEKKSLKTIKALIAHPKTDIKEIKFPLHWAIQNDFADIIPSLIDKKADLNAADVYGYTPLTLAIKKGNVEACGALLKNNEINPNNFDSHDFTPLHYAINNTKIAELLLAHPNTDPNIHFTDGHSPLNFAISSDNLELAQALLNNEKIDPVTPINGLTPLTIALYKLRNKPNAVKIINALLANKKYHDVIYKEAITHLFQVVQSEKDVDILTTLVKAGIPLDIKNEKGETLFSVAVANRNVSALTFMLKEKNADALREEAVSLLFRAVQQDDAVQFKTLLAAGISHLTEVNGQTPLQLAIESGKVNIIKAIHEAHDLETNHHFLNAIENGDIKTVAIMLKAGISPGLSKAGDTALHLAVKKGDVEIVKLLLEYGADPSLPYMFGTTPLRLAVEQDHIDIIKAFLEDDTYRDVMKDHASYLIFIAARQGWTKQIQTLLKAGLSPDVIDRGDTIISTLLNNKRISTLQTLLNDEAQHAVFNKQARDLFFSTNDINIFNALQKAGVAFEKDENGRTRLEIAIEKKQSAIIDALLNDASKREDNLQFLYRAIEKGDTKSVRFILIEIEDMYDITAVLLRAIQSNQVEVVKVILEVASTEIKKLFFSAIENGQIETVRMLLEAGMSPVMCNEEGNTPLHLAVLGNFPAIIDLLLTIDRHPDLKNNMDSTPLLWATQNGNLGIVKLLLANKADPNIANQNGQVPLLHAADVGKFEIVKLLLEHGANPNIKDSAGNTPAMLANQNNHRIVAQIIEAYAATHPLDEPVDTPRYKAISELLDIAVSTSTHKFTQAFSYFKEIDALAQQTLGPTVFHENKEKNKDLKIQMSAIIEFAYHTFKKDNLDESMTHFREKVKRLHEKIKSSSGFMRLFSRTESSREANKVLSQHQKNIKG